MTAPACTTCTTCTTRPCALGAGCDACGGESATVATYLRALLDQVPAGVFVFDREFRALDANRYFLATFCVPLERFIGLDLRTVRDGATLEAMATALDGRAGDYEGPYTPTLTGRTHWIHLRTTPLRDAAGAVIGGIAKVRDCTEEHAAREARDAIAERYRRLVEQVITGIYVIQDGRFAYANDRMAAIFGYTADEFVGLSYLAPIAPDQQALVAASVTARIAGTATQEHYRLACVAKDGRPLVVEFSSSASTHEGRPAIVGTALDVTAQVRAEAELRDREARVRAIYESERLGVFTAALDGRILDCNPCFAAMLGYTPDEIAVLGYEGITFFEDLAADAAAIRPLLDGAVDEYAGEKRYRRRDGGTVWGHATLSLIRPPNEASYVFGVVEDITERKRADEALQAQETLFRTLIEHASDAVLHVDGDQVTRYASPAFARTLGYPPDALVGRRNQDLIHPEDAPIALGMAAALREGRQRVARMEARFRDAAGTYHPMAVTGESLVGHPTLSGIVFTLRDLTAERELESRLRQSQKMEAIGLLAGGVAHDFNNLLTVIGGYTDLLAQPALDDGLRQLGIAEIRRGAQRAAALTQQLLAFSRKQILRPQRLELRAVLDGLAGMLPRLIGEDVVVAVDAGPEGLVVEADPTQLEQVVINLAVNARDAMPRGGHLALTLGDAVLAAPYTHAHGIVPAGRYATLSVADSGSGIPEAILPRIFEPFFTTKEQGKGTGLGLATVLGIVQQSGGHLVVATRPGEGATFTVYLPRAVPGTTTPTSSAAVRRARRGGTILLVEDDPTVRALTKHVLLQAGYAVLEAAHGRDALAVVGRHAGPVDLLLTDLIMPEMGGGELAATLRLARPALAVLFVSGYTDDVLQRRGIDLATVRFLRKPFAGGDLVRAVDGALLTPAPEAAGAPA